MSGKNSAGPPGKPGGLLLNLLTFLFLLASLLMAAYFIYTYGKPNHPLNPLAPPTQVSEIHISEATPTTPAVSNETEAAAQPVGTEAESAAPTYTPTPGPAATLPSFPTATPVVINTLSPTLTDEPRKFVAQEGTPSYLPYSGGCTGLYIAGNITDIDDNPVMLMTVRASGTLGGEDFLIEALSGSNADYTVSGWEIKLSDTLLASTGEITVALYRQGGWEPISEEVQIDTFNDCSRNLIVVNFVQE